MTTQFQSTRSRRAGSWLRRFVRIVVIVIVCLIAVPVIVIPVYRFIDPPASMLMIGRYLSGKDVRHQWVDLADISPHLVRSVLVSEDGRYCSHSGVDWSAVETVMREIDSGRSARGASTITMQTMKNLFLWPGRSYLRKGLEVPLAYYGDLVLGKRRVFEIYLNIAEWGDGIFGAQAASVHYFGQTADKLSAVRAARLATALPNPRNRNPARPAAGHFKLAKVVQKRARLAGAYDDCLFAKR